MHTYQHKLWQSWIFFVVMNGWHCCNFVIVILIGVAPIHNDKINFYYQVWTPRSTSVSVQVRIQDLVKGGPAPEAESFRCSEAESHEQSEQSVAGVQGPLKGPGSFWVFNAQICILIHSRNSFSLILTSILIPKVDKNRALEFTSINLRHSYILHLFFNLHEKVML